MPTDAPASFAAVVTRHPDLAGVEHVHVGLAMRCNNRVAQSRQPTRRRVPRDREWARCNLALGGGGHAAEPPGQAHPEPAGAPGVHHAR
jgi:hypothetical protein